MTSGTTVKLQLPPSLVGSYELTRELAVGGMGVIYLGRDLINQRDVVFKFIAPELLGDDETRQRFINEAKLTAQLNHPNIVQLYGAGEEAGLLYIIYEFIDGQNLKTLLEKYGIYPIGKALDILIKVADGLAYAHQHKILHRDIKPENILVSPLGDSIKIVDFGIAKSMEDSQKLTQTGFIIGTPEYLSPEQAVGHKATVHSDQYAVAVLAYELLTGRLPIEEVNTVDLFTKKIRGDCVPIRERRPEIPVELQKIIDRAMATEAPKRYPAMSDLLNDLRTFAGRRTAGGGARAPGPRSGVGEREPGASGIRGRPLAAGPAPQSTTGTSAGLHRKEEPTVQVPSLRGGYWRDRTDRFWHFTMRIPSAVVYGGVMVPLVIALLWALAPSRKKETGLPRMIGTLAVLHSLDGVTFSWDIQMQGEALLIVEPPARTYPMRHDGKRYSVHMAPASIEGAERMSLVFKQGSRVEAEIRGIPLLGVHVGVDGVTVDVPPTAAPKPVLVYWGKNRVKKGLPCTVSDKGPAHVKLPVDPAEELHVELATGTDPPREPLSLPQRIEPPQDYLERVSDKLDRLGALKVFSTHAADADRDWLNRRVREVVKAVWDELGDLFNAFEPFKAYISSPGLDLALRRSLCERVRRLEVMMEMAKRASEDHQRTQAATDVARLFALPWPIGSRWDLEKSLTGARQPQESQDKILQRERPLNRFRSESLDRAAAKSAVIQLKCLVSGVGTYLKISLNEKPLTYALGPGELPKTVQAQMGTISVTMDAALLKDGENVVELEHFPVAGLAWNSKEILVLDQKLKLVDSGGRSSEKKLHSELK
ncbi:MAG: serine/threonine protein kinase [Candidatus Riflebacteria bacterium]|nr:serine/threonine protein kinase [Candidatus Riflebacteria bacterium]